jgi:ABC-type nitrate/sulfonate/bicarbonate transport system ATPase subunit
LSSRRSTATTRRCTSCAGGASAWRRGEIVSIVGPNADGKTTTLRTIAGLKETRWLEYQVMERAPGTEGGLWTYRRLIDAAKFPGRFP